MKKIFTILITIILVAAFILSGCSQSSPSSAPGPAQTTTKAATTTTSAQQSWPKLSFFAPPSGTQPHTVAVAWSTLAGKYLNGMQITVEPKVGAPQAVVGLLQGQGDMSFVASNIFGSEAPKYIGGKTMASGPMHLVAGLGNAVHIVTRSDSKITSITDFKGKKILGKVAQGGAVDMTRQTILGAYNLTDNDIVLLSGNNGSHLADQLKEGVGDAALFILGLKDASVIDLCTTKDILWIDMAKDKMIPVAEKTWLVAGVIPAGTYPKQSKDVQALRGADSFDVQPTMSEDVAYALTKVFHDHFDEFVKMAPVAKNYDINSVLGSSYLPFHPGAVKYYKEKGIWTAEADAKQKQLLSKTIALPPPTSAPPAAK